MFRRGAEGSIIDLTITAPRLASRISDWSVLEVITLSHHRCIEFILEHGCQAVDKGRGGEGRSPSWNTRRLSRERLREHPEETRLIDELGWVCPAGSLEVAVRSVRQKVVAACDYSMPRRKRRQAKGRCTGGTTSWQPYVENASQHGENSPVQRGMPRCTRHGKGQEQL